MFCTEKQTSICGFIQFYILTKISVEIRISFVYNVIVAVQST